MASLSPITPHASRSGLVIGIALAVALAASLGIGWRYLGGTQFLLYAAALMAGFGAAFLLWRIDLAAAGPVAPLATDWGLMRSVFTDSQDAVAITNRAGKLVCASPRYEELAGHLMLPRELPFTIPGPEQLTEACRAAWRDGEAVVEDVQLGQRRFSALLRRCGQHDDHIVWRFRVTAAETPLDRARAITMGSGGQRLGEAGVMMVVVDGGGLLMAANAVFLRRIALPESESVQGRQLVDLLRTGADGTIRLASDGEGAPSLRIIPIPLGSEQGDEEGPTAFLILDEDPEAITAAAARGAATHHLHGLLAMLPLGLALVERDGRFLFLNEAFARAAGIAAADQIVYPSDLVVEEDKGAVSDAVRRFASGRALPGDLAVRLKNRPEDPVALTIANAKGLGDAAVLLSLKDDSEQSTLKRQIAQATKMQAVGQLAGGVAHDFNNILTAIIGHCDLMAMRHTPGDIDYDDIQQIKHNSNRAAALTRQLLAFSRQQTLRPQVLQLPEVISEISQLIRRLIGETIKLEVKHGRNLGLIRADPGQLEQVIVNLCVNARDAMPEGGRLILQTYSVPASEVRRMRSDIMPIADYIALKVSDTGVGIPQENLSKIFEPFFTTKEVGKGTGLGLSTVYGIVKQTDGFIFANSEMGHGTSFVIYLPVNHSAAPVPQAPVRVEATGELWGTGTILLVEDEAMVRAVAERALTRQGYKVLVAGNGEEALEILDRDGVVIDLLVSDVVMPAMDGPTLVRHARESFPDLKVLFMSGYAEEQLRKSIAIDRVSFLSKPFSVQQLGQAARDAMADA
ncbi:response regulator [Sphingomonas sp. BIUV-7]|uniref:histidine kinase n=1 Tax=Sphingomonas natans TaxID=3063330 RepID=A0ABT8YAG3_9SPHN|nr:ATP-binding protein [Sphingomonas sp. BIUV-7]MDO6414645.1 response regulator [Sphingomonas sp. BIUV-7]